MQPVKMLILAAVVLVSVWFAAGYAAQRSDNSYEVVVGPQKSDMQRMIEAYERLSAQYLIVVQDNMTFMANQDRQILEKLTVLEKKIDALTEKVDALAKQPVPGPVPVETPVSGDHPVSGPAY
jgi:outer membrane murein-binding lipoprotein Lpp